MSCADSQNLKKGNGVTTQFNFDFPYNKQSDVNVSLLNQTTEEWEKTSAWSWANATTIEFDTAPPTPNPDVANIKIWRLTSVEPLDAVFNPGSAIRAEDLNSNFEQLQFAAEEARCSSSDLVDGGIDLENLGDVEIGNIQDGQIIEWDGTNWVNTDWNQADWTEEDTTQPGFIQNKPDAFGTTYLGTRNCVQNGPTGDEPAGGFYVNTANGEPDAGWGLPQGTQLGINDRVIKLEDDTWSIFGVGNNVVAQDTPPDTALGGDLWWDSGTTTALYFYYVDDDGGQWVPCTPSGGVVGSDEITNGSVTPEKLSTGGPYWDTSGDLIVGNNPQGGGGKGAKLDNEGRVTACQDDADDVIWAGYRLNNSSRTSTIYASGAAVFNDTVHNTSGGYKFPDGTIQTTASTGGGGGGSGVGANAWATFNARTDAMNASRLEDGYNVSETITRLGEGEWSIEFINPMPTDDYAVVFGNQGESQYVQQARAKTVNGFTVRNYTSNVIGASDASVLSFAIFATAGGGADGGGGSGADAWGNVSSTGEALGGFNYTVSSPSDGTYDVSFVTAMPNVNYSVTATSANSMCQVLDLTTTGFRIRSRNSTGDLTNGPVYFAVFAANAIAPQYGVGADAWGRVSNTASLLGGFNIASVGRVPGESSGAFRITFTTPMPTEEYSVVMTPINSQYFGGVSAQTKTSFDVYLRNASNNDNLGNSEFSFTVFASSTVTPTYTWTRDGTILKTANAGDSVLVGEDPLNANNTAAGCVIQMSGNTRIISSTTATGTAFSAKTVGEDGAKAVIYGDGDAEFGRIQSTFITAEGSVAANRTTGANPCFSAQLNGTQNILIRADGQASKPGGGSWTDINSERRLKENLIPLDPEIAWETVKSLPYYQYNFISDPDNIYYGPVVDECPEDMVLDIIDEDDNGEPKLRSDDQGALRTYNNLLRDARMFVALQTALTRIETLEAEVQALKGGTN